MALQTQSIILSNVPLDVNVQVAAADTSNIHGGCTFAQLPSASNELLGNIYNIIDSFTTTTDFVEGAGLYCPAGTAVKIVAQDDVYKYHIVKNLKDIQLSDNNENNGVLIKYLEHDIIMAEKQAQIKAPRIDTSGNIVLTDPTADYMLPVEDRLEGNLLETAKKNPIIKFKNSRLQSLRHITESQQITQYATISLAALSSGEATEGDTIHLIGGTAAN